MDGKVIYNSLNEAANSLNADAQKISDYIDNYMQSLNQIGEIGAAAWGGTAAEQALPVLKEIKEDITKLQDACNEFSENINNALVNYESADATSVNKVTNIQ